MILSTLSLIAALQARLEGGHVFAARDAYLGASEIGLCLRYVLARKREPLPLDSASAGRMLAGRVLENEIVQIIRNMLPGQVRETGRQQRELLHPKLPFRAHPDGRLALEDGDVLLEIKTASASSFKHYCEGGLPAHYLDQVQAQMGLSGIPRALVLLVSREDLSQTRTFEVMFNSVHYAALEQRAALAAVHLVEGTLPEGEPDRGFCHSCPLAGQCEALQKRKAAAEVGNVPEVLRLQIEAELEELAGLETDLGPMQERVTELRTQLREALVRHNLPRVDVGLGSVQLITSTRSGLDTRKLQQEAPELYQRCQKSALVTQLRISYRGSVQQAS